MIRRRARTVVALLVLSQFRVPTAPAQDAAKAKKDPRAKLAEPWPDAERMRERREDALARRLFQSREPLAITLTADFKAVNKDRHPKSTKRFPAVLSVAGDDGQPRSIPVQLSTRGHSRLMKLCGFVPLRLEFPKEETKGTAFESQDALKLVTHCNGGKEYEQYLLRDHLAYRILNLFTPRSFRVRLARTSYVDSSTGQTLVTRWATFLESESDLARRLDGRIAELPRTLFRDFDSDELTLMMLFEYMIGNTDFSIFVLHNVRLVQDQARVLHAVPYDFDFSGLVDAHYALPATALKLRSVRDRLYRGPCRSVEELQPLLAAFRARKAEVMAEVESLPDLDTGSRRSVKSYLEEFYATLDDRSALRHELVDGCGKKAGM